MDAARAAAAAAVAAENNGAADVARDRYEAAAAAITEAVRQGNAKDAEDQQEVEAALAAASAYRARAVVLADLLSEARSSRPLPDLSQPEWRPDPSVPQDTPAADALQPMPTRAAHLPFWLLQRLLRSLEQPGAYLTPALFVPTAVWFQPGVKLAAMTAKTDLFLGLQSAIRALLSVVPRVADVPPAQLAAVLANMLPKLDTLQTSASIHMQIVPELAGNRRGERLQGTAKLQEGLRLFGANVVKSTMQLKSRTLRDRITEDCEYIHVLRDTLVASMIWSDPVWDAPEHAQSMARISSFYRDVVLPLAMQDLRVLIDAYLRTQQQALASSGMRGSTSGLAGRSDSDTGLASPL